jgi:hypothetical protein
MIVLYYFLGVAWLCWWVLKRDGTWREAAALFFAPIVPACIMASLFGKLPWVLFVAFAHMTALASVPIYWVLRRNHGIGLGFPLSVGAVSGVVTSFALHDWRMPGHQVWAFVGMGLVAGGLFWMIGHYSRQTVAQ